MKKTRLFNRVSEILSICIFLCGSVVLVGWILDIPVLKSISPNFVTMKANTAICFIFIGLSLWLLQTRWQGNRTAREIARLCAFVVFLIGFLTFWEYMLGRNFGIDQFLFKESATAVLTSSPGRMAFNTSIIFVTIGISLFMAGFEAALFSWLAQLLVIPAGILSLLSFLGYLYGASPLYIGLKFSTAMAVHTCVLFLMSCIGCLFVRPQQGFMQNISSDNLGGLMLRRILPVVIVIPPVLGWLKIHGAKTGFFGNEFGVSFVATFNLVIFGFFIYMLSVRLNRLDAKRKQTEVYGEMNKEILQILNEPEDLQNSIQHILATLKMRTGFDAVGIRLQDGDDFPYFAQEGFSKDFLLTENTLIERTADGGVCRDKDGNVSLECTCGLVISGKTDPASPFFTSGGSFWTNNSFPLLDIPPSEDPRLHPRNQCIHQGYASVALIPIRTKNRIVGLMHFNDRRKGCFTLDTVELMEGIALYIGSAMMRKQAEEALKVSEEKSRLLLDSAAEAIYGIDMNGNCTFCNNTCLKILGYKSSDELLGKNMHRQIHSKRPDGTPFPVEECRIFRAFQKGEGSHVDDEVLWRADGASFPAEYWSFPQRRDGVVIGAVVTFFDITARKLAEDGLRKLSRAVEQNPACIVITDTEGNIEYVNPTFTKLTGYTFQDVLGKNPRILKSGLMSLEEYKLMWDTIKSGHEWRGEFCNKKKNGELYFENASISPVINEAGVITNFVANKEDITDRKKAEKEMNEAIEMKTKFISTASHELRTPLTSIKEGVNLVYSETTGPLNDDQKEFLGIAKKNVDRLARLINDVLDYQKMTAGRMVFNIESASINETVKSVEETMRPLTKEKGLELILELDDAVPLVNFDNDKIIQVLTNLVNNAIKFTETGSIKITTSRGDNNVITAVKDSGGGIKQEDIPRLFQEFEQLATKDADRKVGGTGLGLAISKKIVENHGGRIWVESDYGKGTTFYFELPMEKIPCQIES